MGNCLLPVEVEEFQPPTARFSKKLFFKCFSSVLYKNEKYPFEGVIFSKSL